MKKFAVVAKLINDKVIIQHCNKQKDVDEWINLSQTDESICELSVYQRDGLGYDKIWSNFTRKIGF